MSSLSILIINAIGWRANYIFMGVLGIGLSLCANFLIREPGVREKFNIKEKKQNILKTFAKKKGEKVSPKADDEDTRSWL